MAFVYILKDKNGKYYVGSTPHVEERVAQHKKGYTHSTKRMQKFKIVLRQEYPTLQQARKVEYKIKSMKRKDYVEKMVKEGKIRVKL